MARRDLPTGTVTFLFSDIVGSTRLVAELGPAVFTEVLERHNGALRAAFARHGAVERGTQGDSFLVMFREAPAAVAAAADAQLALAAVAWPAAADVRVRVGLHTGVGMLGGDDYVGLDVHRAARIAAAAHGGQVLLSDATRALTEADLPAGLSLRSLGEIRLRDLSRPERVHQLVIDGLPSDFPPPKAEPASGGNLPERLTSFVGREDDLTALGDLLAAGRLVTLTGPGGTGKTSLAVELARRHAGAFARGAWWVPLEAVADPALVEATVASALGLLEAPGSTGRERLVGFLADGPILLVIDNFEQVLPAASLVADLIGAAPDLKVVVTSRAPLRLAAEQEYPVSPLAVPGPVDPVAEALESPAVRLFVERARRVRPSYALSREDAPAVAEICRRLDGLPLGIELAASRIGLLPAHSIADRLSRRLDLPGRPARDVPERQRSLEAAIAWSYDLLEPPEQRLLTRLSVVAGGCRLEEAEAIAGPAAGLGIEVLDGLSVLVDQSLVRPEPDPEGARFGLLDTIRRFAADRLEESGEADEVRRRHALAYLDLAEAAAPHLPSRGQVVWLDRLAIEHDNLRAAIRWAIDADEAEIALPMAASIWRFWQLRGFIAEGRTTLAEILALPSAAAPSIARARALEAAGGLEWWSANVPDADAFYAAELELARALGDERSIADALFNLAHTRFVLKVDPRVHAMRDEAIERYRALGDERAVTRTRWTEGYELLATGHAERARDLMLELLTQAEAFDDEFYVGLVTLALSGISLSVGDLGGSMRWGVRSIRSSLLMGDLASATLALRGAAVLLVQAEMPHEGAAMFGAHEALSRRLGIRPPATPEEWILLGWETEATMELLTSEAHAADVRRGAELSLDEAVDELLQLIGVPDDGVPQRPGGGPEAPAATGARPRSGRARSIDAPDR